MQKCPEQKAALSRQSNTPGCQGVCCSRRRHYAGRRKRWRGSSCSSPLASRSPPTVYGGKFNDDKAGFKTKFKRGSLAMANSGKNTNSSQFFVVLTDDEPQLAKLDGKYVHFGQLGDGWEVLDALDGAGGGADGKPTQPAWVGGCGLI